MPIDQEESLRRYREKNEAIRQSIGIDLKFRPTETVFNQASSTLVASVEHYSTAEYERRLFFRHASERAYQPISIPSPDIHHFDVVSSSSLPLIYYLVYRMTKHTKPGEFGGDWISVDRFNLTERTGSSIMTREGLRVPQPYKRAWVSQLLGVAKDDSELFCSCGLQSSEATDVHYWLCSIRTADQNVTPVSRLEGIWF